MRLKATPRLLVVALRSVRGEVGRYWKTAVLLGAALAAGLGFAWPALLARGRLVPVPIPGGDLGLQWRAGVQTAAWTQQEAVDALGTLWLGIAVGTLLLSAITILIVALARESERAAELTVRRAVGAGRRALLASAWIEAGLVGLAALAAGSLIASVTVVATPDWPGSLRTGSPMFAAVAASVLGLILLAGVTFPVLFPRRRIGEAEPRSPTPLTPSAIQIGASLIALTAGALLARHAAHIGGGGETAPAGSVYSIAMRDTAPADRARQYAGLLRSLEADRGAMASLTSPGVLLGVGPVGTVTTDCGECSEGGLPVKWKVKAATHRFVSADTFQMLGVNLVEGRAITSADGWDAPRVAVINRNLAAREFQNGQPLGRGIRVVDDGDRWATVVGVVDDPPPVGVGASVQPRYTVYLSVLQYPPATTDLLTRENRPGVLKAAHAALAPGALDPVATTLRAVLDGQATLLGWFAAQLGLQGWAMLGIAALGSLAVARLWVSSLMVELGVRRALGARRRQTVGYVLLRGSAVCAIGIAGGIWFGASIWSILGGLVPGLDPWDPGLVLRYGSILLVSVLLGAVPPAWRASRRTPASLLASS